MAAWMNIRKAGLLASPAFLLAGCGNSASTQEQHAVWFFTQPHILISFLFILGLATVWIWRRNVYSRHTSQSQLFRLLPIVSTFFFTSAAVFLICAVILQFIESSGQHDSITVFGTYVSDPFLRKALCVYILMLAMGAIFAALPHLIRYSYNTSTSILFWMLTIMALAMYYFGVPIYELIQPSGVIASSLLTPTSPPWSSYWIYPAMGGAVIFAALIVEANVKKRPVSDRLVHQIVGAFE